MVTVLIVDDDPIFVEMLSFVLAHGGFETRPAYDGKSALQALSAELVDIIVLDVMLPDMDGFEICRHIRDNPRSAEIPILMLSARTQVADKLSGFESGADDYVGKPADPKEIVARIRALLARSHRTRPQMGQTLAFVGAKGGVGTTTTALNLALAIREEGHRVLYMEVGGIGLSAAWTLGLRPTHNLLDLTAPEGFRLSMASLETCIIEYAGGLCYLPGHDNTVRSDRYRPGMLADTVAMLQAHFDFTILDVGSSALSAGTDLLLHSTAIIPVSEHDAASIWQLSALLGWLKTERLSSKIPGFVLVDRSVGPVKDSTSRVASQTGLGILTVIPPATDELYYATTRQEPLLTAAPDGAASAAFRELAGRLCQPSITVAPTLRP
ncbi:MAG: response regulator [Anaerolineae bacterium]